MENRKHAVMETILHRPSIRRFAPEQVREEELQQILQAGLYAPSAGGRQGPIFVVSQDRAVSMCGWDGSSGPTPIPGWPQHPAMSPGSSPASPMIPRSQTPFTGHPQ